MNCEPEKLYCNYKDKGAGAESVQARANQRLGWLKQYKKNGKCKQKLIKAGILKGAE